MTNPSWESIIGSAAVNSQSRLPRPRIVAVILTVIILAAVLSYLFVAKSGLIGPHEVVSLTKEQREVDDFLKNYYDAYGNGSVNRLISLFDDEAILSAADGSVYKGLSEIRLYYAQLFLGFEGSEIRTTVLQITVRGQDAQAKYNVRVRTWHFGATEPPQFFYDDSFDLKKMDDTWKITALLTEISQPR